MPGWSLIAKKEERKRRHLTDDAVSKALYGRENKQKGRGGFDEMRKKA